MLRLLSDENFNGDIIRGMFLRQPTLDLLRIHHVGLQNVDDPTILEWAALNERIVVTHDRATMPDFAYERLVKGEQMAGLIALPMSALEEFCRRWQIQELAVFGSVLRDDFSSSSDVDFLYVLMPNVFWSLADLIKAEDELTKIIGRRIDLVSKKSIQINHNWLRRKNILSSARIIYAQK